MSQRAVDLALKKQALLMDSARLRQEFAGHVHGLAPLASIVDTGWAGVSWLRSRPEWMLGGALVLALLMGPRKVLGLGMRMWGWAQLLLRLRRSVSGLMSHRLAGLLFRKPPSTQGEP